MSNFQFVYKQWPSICKGAKESTYLFNSLLQKAFKGELA